MGLTGSHQTNATANMTVIDVSEELSALAQHNLRLLETGNYHDFVIKCGDRQFKVHRNIVCPQSFLLTSLCDPTWKVSAIYRPHALRNTEISIGRDRRVC